MKLAVRFTPETGSDEVGGDENGRVKPAMTSCDRPIAAGKVQSGWNGPLKHLTACGMLESNVGGQTGNFNSQGVTMHNASFAAKLGLTCILIILRL
jgi:hypothetical protein